MKSRLLIGLGYKKGSGKDTVADYLVRMKGAKKMAFADSLKGACRELFSFTEEQLYGSRKEAIDEYWGFSPREIMQKLGTDLFRNQVDKEIWIKTLDRKISLSESPIVVISDVRFENEATYIKESGGILINVFRNLPDSDTHESENSLVDYREWDHTINNTEGLFELFQNTEQVFDRLEQRKNLNDDQ